MDGAAGEGIYRAMIEDKDGMPVLGMTALKLGVRRGVDIVPDQAGKVHLPAFHPGEANGLSCSPTILDIPVFALPLEWGGPNPKTKIWQIEETEIPLELLAREDTVTITLGRHISVGPSRTMSFDDYLRAIQATRLKWKKVTKN